MLSQHVEGRHAEMARTDEGNAHGGPSANLVLMAPDNTSGSAVTTALEGKQGYQQRGTVNPDERAPSALRAGQASDALAQARGGLWQGMGKGVDKPAPPGLRKL